MVPTPVAMKRCTCVVLALALAACGTLPQQRGVHTDAPREQPPTQPEDDTASPSASDQVSRSEPREGAEVAIYQPRPEAEPESLTRKYPTSLDAVSGPAVVSLVEQANGAAQQDRYQTATAVLERALRIEPRNAFVWARLAEMHLKAGDLQQAAATADRANSLARGNPYLEVRNWRTIAEARRAQGDHAGAQAASQKAEHSRLRQSGGD